MAGRAIKRVVRRGLLRYAPSKLYPRPLTGLQPERLYAYLDALWQHRDVQGAVLEIGCHLGGTAAIAHQMLKRTGYEKQYVCVDTFKGFVETQFDRDVELGTSVDRRKAFSENSRELVERLLRSYGCGEIELVEGDIVAVPDEALPKAVSVCLADVDLDVPTYEGLKRIYPRLTPGGIILVDDCPENYGWAGARTGYQRFVEEQGLPERYFMGMGLINKEAISRSQATAVA